MSLEYSNVKVIIMKIAVSSQGREKTSAVDPRFGRASWFVVLDSETGDVVDVIDNTAAQDAAHGAGINAATVVAESGVNAVLTGRVGPKAFAVLDAAGIKVVSDMNGTVEDALARFQAGGMEHDKAPTSNGHPSMAGGNISPPAGGGGRCGGAGMGRGGGAGMGGGGRGRGGCGCGGGRRGR